MKKVKKGGKRKNRGKTRGKKEKQWKNNGKKGDQGKEGERGKTAWEYVELHRYACVHTSHSFQVTSVREIT